MVMGIADKDYKGEKDPEQDVTDQTEIKLDYAARSLILNFKQRRRIFHGLSLPRRLRAIGFPQNRFRFIIVMDFPLQSWKKASGRGLKMKMAG